MFKILIASKGKYLVGIVLPLLTQFNFRSGKISVACGERQCETKKIFFFALNF